MPNEDFVSRQWLIDEYHRRHKGPPGGALKMIEEAPAADVVPRPRWIPAAERLPEEDGKYLVVLQFEGNPRMVCEYRTVPGMWMVKATVGWWMPVPENPKEENGDVEEE